VRRAGGARQRTRGHLRAHATGGGPAPRRANGL
jgi:hypothetical protein